MANLDLLNQFWKQAEQGQTFRSYAPTIRKLRPFTLDAELAGVVSGLANSNAKALRSYLRSARLPYPEMWIEADYATAFQHLDRPLGNFRLHDGQPHRIGWVLLQAPGDIITMSRIASLPDPDEPGEERAHLYPVSHLVSDESIDGAGAFHAMRQVHPEVANAIRDCNADPTFQLLGWGGDRMAAHRVYRRGGVGPQIELARKGPLAQTNVAVIEPKALELCINPVTPDDRTPYERSRALLEAGMEDQQGEIAFVIAALALLNEVPVKYVPYKPSGVLRAGGRLKPFMSSSIVTIEVPATRRRLRDIQDHLKVKGREAIRHARHEVRGYWMHAKALPKCEQNLHRWEKCEDRPGWRIWIPHHERGDASLGWVRQTYHGVRARGPIPGTDERIEHGVHA